MEALFNVFLPKVSELMFFPPGYMSLASLQNVIKHKKANTGGVKIEDLIARGVIIVGSPDTVRRELTRCHHELGFQEFLALLQFATLPPDLTEGNIRRFAAEVVPAIHALTDKQYRGYESKIVRDGSVPLPSRA